MIRLNTLGALELRDASGTELRSVIAQSKRAALLSYLAIASGRGPIRRDTLLPLFWSDLDDDRARGALNQALHFLRRALGPDAIVSPNGTDLRIDPEQLWCDAVAFEESCRRGRLSEAVDAYHGDLLEGFHITGAAEFERWLDIERERLAALYMQALERLAGESDARGDAARAVGAWRRLAGRDPLSSRVALGLMRALAASGDVEAAFRHARIHETLLRQELNVGPAPAIAQFLASITSSRRDAPASPSSSPSTAGFDRDVFAAERSTSDVPMLVARRRRWVRGFATVAAALTCVVLTGVPETTDRTLPYVHELLQAGRAAEKNRSPIGIATAKSYYQRAIELDPDHALAYAALSRIYSLTAQYGYAPAAAALDSARMMASKAVTCDPTLPDAYTALGLALGDAGDADVAERAFIRALELDPGHADAHYWYAILLLTLGRVQDARREAALAARYDPLSPRGTLVVERYAQFYETGQRVPMQWDSLLTFEPGEPWLRRAYALYMAAGGRCDDARREIGVAEQYAREVIQMMFAVALVHRLCGDSAAAVAMMDRAKRHPRAGDEGMWIAMMHAPFGERDSAFAWLDRQVWTIAERMDLGANRWLDSLRSDPRYLSALQRAGLASPRR